MTDELVYICRYCLDVFDRGDLFHCRTCDHHYLAGDGDCSNCHQPARKRSDMQRTRVTFSEWMKRHRPFTETQAAMIAAYLIALRPGGT